MWGEGASDLWGRLERDEDEREAELREALRARLRGDSGARRRRRRTGDAKPRSGLTKKTRGPLRPAGPGCRQGRTPVDNSLRPSRRLVEG